MITAGERFDAKVEPVPFSGCWLWLGWCDKKAGYGMFWFGGTMQLAHRVSYQLHVGQIPAGMHVCHSCDVPSCVNPRHLWLGTNDDNIADKVRKGRQALNRGVNHPSHRLSENDVRDIRASRDSNRLLQSRYGLEKSTINKIRNRSLWRHV